MDSGYSIRILMLGAGVLMLVVLIMSGIALFTERYGTAETQSQSQATTEKTTKESPKVVVTTQDVKEMRNLLTVSNLLVALLSVLAVSNGVALFHVCRSLRKFQNSKEFFHENIRKE